jgi:hypothetical protein
MAGKLLTHLRWQSFSLGKATLGFGCSTSSRGRTALALTTLLFMLTACRQEPLSLPVTHAAGVEPQTGTKPETGAKQEARTEISSRPKLLRARRTAQARYEPGPGVSCYSFIHLRPRSQRDEAAQARLEQADRMVAALDSGTVLVDIIGDHVNILSLQFPAVWPAAPSYSDHISSIVLDYFSSPDIEDYMCNSGFAEVRLSAWGLNDRRFHRIWTARVTSEGLLKLAPDGEELAGADPLTLR